MKAKRTSGEGSKKLKKFIKDRGAKKTAKSGWFPNNKYSDGKFVAQVAAQNEFGTDKIPARPFVRPTISEKKREWAVISEVLAKKLIDGQIDFNTFFNQFILVVEGDVRDKIRSIQEPALAESTIKARLSKLKSGKRTGTLEKPLIDTAIMINSLTKIVE